MRVLISGSDGGSNVGGSFRRAAERDGHEVRMAPLDWAFGGPRLWRTISWRLLGRRPSTFGQYQTRMLAILKEFQPDILLTTGVSPVSKDTLATFRAKGCRVANYSTDDPWNPGHTSHRYLDSIPEYDAIFSPRKANLADFQRAGSHDTRYLPFAYDPDLIPAGADRDDTVAPVVFVGGGDDDRVKLLMPLAETEIPFAIYGSFWGGRSRVRDRVRGQVAPVDLARITRSAAINLCLVRRANRDQHVMRSFEIPAIGGFVLAEDTADHRDIYGDTVAYFRNADDLVTQVRFWLSRSEERGKMAKACHDRICENHHTYADRFRTICNVLNNPGVK